VEQTQIIEEETEIGSDGDDTQTERITV